MKNNWDTKDSSPDFELEEQAKKSMNKRMRDYAKTYLKIVKKAIAQK